MRNNRILWCKVEIMWSCSVGEWTALVDNEPTSALLTLHKSNAFVAQWSTKAVHSPIEKLHMIATLHPADVNVMQFHRQVCLSGADVAAARMTDPAAQAFMSRTRTYHTKGSSYLRRSGAAASAKAVLRRWFGKDCRGRRIAVESRWRTAYADRGQQGIYFGIRNMYR